MRNSLWVVLFLLITLVAVMFWGCADDENRNGDTRTFQEIWFPCEIGYRWTSEQNWGDSTIIITVTIVADTILNGTKFFIKRYDYPLEIMEPYAWFWHVDISCTWWLLCSDTIYVYSFPFVENEWQFRDSSIAFDSLPSILGWKEEWWFMSAHNSVAIIAGEFTDCWFTEMANVTHDTVEGVIDTFFSDEGYYLAEDIGWIKGNSKGNLCQLVSFETNVDVDSLYIIPEEDKKQSHKYDRLGHLIFEN